MAQPVRLKLDGKAFDLNPPRPWMAKMKEFLDKAKPDELYTPAELARKVGVVSNTLSNETAMLVASLGVYTTKVGAKRYWGNPRAIIELLRQTANEG